MKKLLLPIIMLISGCSVQPIQYDMSTSGSFPPIQTKQNISNVEVGDFKYEPHVRISQNTVSQIGCLPCQSDGSTAGFVFATPVNEIVKAEIENALQELVVPAENPSCKLGATIHMAAWDVMNGDSIVDLTFTLVKEEKITYIKRIRGHYDSGLFEGVKLKRFLAKASRKSVGLLVTNNGFLKELKNSCS